MDDTSIGDALDQFHNAPGGQRTAGPGTLKAMASYSVNPAAVAKARNSFGYGVNVS